jgi:hypothetical protein
MISARNPHIQNVERAAYELGNLLLGFDKPMSVTAKLSEDDLDKLDAIETHAYNARESVLDGIEAIGALLYQAADNDSSNLDRLTLRHIGSLVRHLAVEAQFLCSVEEESAGIRIDREKTLAKKGGNHG